MNRRQLRKLAKIRLLEAEALLNGRLPDGAYYLAGYAVECGLKACIAKMTRRHEFPDRDFARDSYTHDYSQLLKTAKLLERFRGDLKADRLFAASWTIVNDWSEDSRYARWTQSQARAMVEAAGDPAHGVLQWIERHW